MNLCDVSKLIPACDSYTPSLEHLPKASECEFFCEDGERTGGCVYSAGGSSWVCSCQEAQVDARAMSIMENL